MLTALILAGAASFSFPNPDGAASAAQAPGMVVTMVTAGLVDAKGVIPMFNGVPGATVNNWDIALPLTVLTGGQNYVIEALVNDINYTGGCHGYFELTQNQSGKKVVLAKYIFAGGTCNSGLGYGGYEEVTVPKSPGAATLTAVIKYGSNKSVLSVPMVIQ